MLVDTGSYSLHKVRNAFGKGITSYGSDVEKLCLELIYWFKNSAARQEDLQQMQQELGFEKTFY